MDSFGTTYSLQNGQTSPNGKWYDVFNGQGSAGVKKDSTGQNVFYEQPATSTTKTSTEATFIISTQKFTNYKSSIDFRTDSQLRQNSPPNSWEVAWVFLKHVDSTHHYYFCLRTNGWELGKKDNLPGDSTVERQIYLQTGSYPIVEIGRTYHLDWTIIGNHITVSLDGQKLADLVDNGSVGAVDTGTLSPYRNVNGQTTTLAGKGSIGMYTEDAAVSFKNVYLTPLS